MPIGLRRGDHWRLTATSAVVAFSALSCHTGPGCPPAPPGWLLQIAPADCVSPTSGLLSSDEIGGLVARLESAHVASTIGVAEGDDEQIVGVVADVTVDPRGFTIIADRGRRDVRVYDEMGRYRQTIGSEGSGPGEFRAPHVMAFDSDGVLYVDDHSLRVQRFGISDGEYVYLDEFRWEMAVEDFCILRDTIYVQGRRLGHGMTDSVIHKVTLAGEALQSFGQVFVHASDAVAENYHRGRVACIEALDAIAFMPFQVPGQIRLYTSSGSLQWITRFSGVRELIVESLPEGLYSQTVPDGGFHGLETMTVLDSDHLLVQLALWTQEQPYSTRVPARRESYVVSIETGHAGFLGDSLGMITIERGRVVQVAYDPFPRVVVRE